MVPCFELCTNEDDGGTATDIPAACYNVISEANIGYLLTKLNISIDGFQV